MGKLLRFAPPTDPHPEPPAPATPMSMPWPAGLAVTNAVSILVIPAPSERIRAPLSQLLPLRVVA